MRICNFQGAVPIGAPKDWIPELDGPCGVIYVQPHLDVQTGLTCLYSVYKPTPEDLEALNAGGCLRLGVVTQKHPVINMVILFKERCDSIGVVPLEDLGGPE